MTLVLSAVAQAHFIVFVIDEMTTVLQIRVFRVKPVRVRVVNALESGVA